MSGAPAGTNPRGNIRMRSVTRLPIIDADGHVFEPFSIWEERLPEKYRQYAFKRTVAEDGTERVLFYGFPADIGYSVGTLCTPGAVARGGRLDIDIEGEVDRGVHDPTRRLELMDRQGVAASVLFPTMCLGLDDIPDPVFRMALARAYNDWIAEFCARDPLRLRWAGVIPLEAVDAAAAEVDRVLAAGATTVMLSPIPTKGAVTLGDPSRNGIWARLAEADRPAVVHAANPDSLLIGLDPMWKNRGQWQMGVPFLLQLGLLHLIDGGVLERHPRLRVGIFEGDVGWLPHFLGRLDETYEKMALVARTPRIPALEQFRRQCVISGEPADRGLLPTCELVGTDHVLWASDWPHQDGSWPDPIAILRDRDDLTDEQKREMFVDGAAAFFGIDVDALLAHLGGGWSRSAALADIPDMLEPRRPS
jgi:predicted TIM-barrel fold metal-dependent hydrolase